MAEALHTFVVCAYKESPYLPACIESLRTQHHASTIIIATSTPCSYITTISNQLNIPVAVNPHGGSICRDWTFALSQAHTPYVTLAHQDDVYLPSYSENAITRLRQQSNPLIFFSDYGELRDGKQVDTSLNLKVKRLLLSGIAKHPESKAVRRRALSFGNPICCPSVTYAVENLPTPCFQEGFRSNLDWDAWERLSKLAGSFCYEPAILMRHRVHEGSETSSVIRDDVRSIEDFEILKRFWPAPIAKTISSVYQLSERSNSLEK